MILSITGIVIFAWYDINIRSFQDSIPPKHIVSKDKHKDISFFSKADNYNDVLEILAKSKKLPSKKDNNTSKNSTESKKSMSSKKDDNIKIVSIDSDDFKPKEKEFGKFHCDGRIYCSQMTSCAEATYFLKNCPNTKMDGDGDSIPCERQWCN